MTKSFGRRDRQQVTAVAGLSIEIAQAEMVVVVGPSGCGKTTLLRCVAGLEEPDRGEIYIRDRLVSAPERDVYLAPEKRNIGMMFQSYALWPHMSVRDNVAYPLRARKYPRDEIASRTQRLLELTGLAALRNEFPTRLSGGQQQRVALARSLVAHPDIVLFDEPLSNVDAKVREELRVEISRMQRELGFAALYVTHDQDEAMQMADRLVLLQEGRIAQLGSPESVYVAPGSRYAARFMGSSCEIPGTGSAAHAGDGSSLIETDIGRLCVSPGEHPPAAGAPVAVMIRTHDIQVSESDSAFDGPNVFPGVVRVVMFMGHYFQYLVTVNNTQLRVVTDTRVRLAEGAAVRVRLPAEKLMYFPEGSVPALLEDGR